MRMQISSMLDALIILFTLTGHIKILLRTVTTTYTSSQLMSLFLKLELLMIGSHNIFKVKMVWRYIGGSTFSGTRVAPARNKRQLLRGPLTDAHECLPPSISGVC